jgi:hypothetical protein
MGAPVTIRFNAAVGASPTSPAAIVNTADVDGGMGQLWSLTAIANAEKVYLPLVRR